MSLFRNTLLIDTIDDHLERSPIDTNIINDWIVECHSEGDMWYCIELHKDNINSKYNYCLCGHEILHNCVVMNKTKQIGFIVGNKCVDKFKKTTLHEIIRTSKICLKCDKPMPKSKKDICTECAENILVFGKHKGKYMIDVFHDDRPYCNWFLTQDARTPNSNNFKHCIRSFIYKEKRRNEFIADL
jgi:hypothetical protein